MPTKKTTPDITLLILTFTLLAIGLIMVYSASAVWAEYKFDDSFFFAKRQMLFAGVGIILDLENLGKGFNHHLLCPVDSCANPRSWEYAKWIEKLDWNWGFLSSTV